MAFWQLLDEHGIPNTIFRIPSNFPPVAARGKTLSGMGTPDLRGTYGTFSFYTDDPAAVAGAVEGGQIIPVQVENSRVTANLIGPDNSFRKGSPAAVEPFSVAVDPLESVAKVVVQGREFVLREGEWSGWIHVEFRLVPVFANVKGMCRFYLKQAHPQSSRAYRDCRLRNRGFRVCPLFHRHRYRRISRCSECCERCSRLCKAGCRWECSTLRQTS